jgi:hypothetical protein
MNLKTLFASTIALALFGVAIAPPKAIAADTCNYNLGPASTGQTTRINLCSIQRQPQSRVDFVYSLGSETIPAQANCRNNTWLTYPEKATHSPQSQATIDMLKIACTAPSSNDGIGIGVVFDPPSKIRDKPNGTVICTIRDLTAIELAGGVTGGGEWYRTRACGGGVIHKSQIRFN